MATKQDVYRDIEQTLGMVPTFVKSIPDNTIEYEWNLFKKTQMEEGPVPNKYRELIGLGIAAATKCKYCTYFHTVSAQLNGATQEEITDALSFAKSVSGWSTYINGLMQDFDEFKYEIDRVGDHIRKTAGVGPNEPVTASRSSANKPGSKQGFKTS